MNYLRRHWILATLLTLFGLWLGVGTYFDHKMEQENLAKQRKAHEISVERKMREQRRTQDDFFWLQAYYKKTMYGQSTSINPDNARPTAEEIATERRLDKEAHEKALKDMAGFPLVLQKAKNGDRASIIRFGERGYADVETDRKRNYALIDLAKKGNPEAQFWAYMNRAVLMSGLPDDQAKKIALDNLKAAVRKEHPAAIIYFVNDVYVNGLKNPSMGTLMLGQMDATLTYLDSMTSGSAMRVDPLDDVQVQREKQVKMFRDALVKAKADMIALKGKGLYSDQTIDQILKVADGALSDIGSYTHFKMNRNVVGAAIGAIK